MMTGLTPVYVDEYLKSALKEDINYEDVTTNAVIGEEAQGVVDLIAKQDGVLAGSQVFLRVFQLLEEEATFTTNYVEGQKVQKGEKIGEVKASVRTLLAAERTALNYLQRMSGIATYTRDLVNVLEGKKTKLLDTRKTTPNMRIFEKYAVKVGGGCNHRYNLSDGILLKDNHIDAAGGVTKAIELARSYAPFVRKIEVEVETLEMLEEAVLAGADIIMLDNMDVEKMKEAVKRVAGRAQTECSGNITKEKLQEIAEIGVDFVSCGALTHSAPILDFSLKNLRVL